MSIPADRVNIPVSQLYMYKLTGDVVWWNHEMSSPKTYSSSAGSWCKFRCEIRFLIPINELKAGDQ